MMNVEVVLTFDFALNAQNPVTTHASTSLSTFQFFGSAQDAQHIKKPASLEAGCLC
jgi:hypothetical protein